MNALLRALTRRSPKKAKSQPSFRPALETLEDRAVPTVTFYGGAVLHNVRVQALFLGSQWRTDPALAAQAQYLSGALGSIVNSSYMDALSNAGYGAGRGTVAPSQLDPDPDSDYKGNDGNLSSFLNPMPYSDWRSSMERVLTFDITYGGLPGPSANTLYVLFVDPSGSASGAYGPTSHGSFQLRIPHVATAGSLSPVRYALIDYPVGNTGVPFLSTLDNLATTLSREVADAVTDPDLGYYDRAYPQASHRRGWYDNSAPGTGEVGEIVKDRVVYVNGYAMERIANKDDYLMTPAQAASSRAVNFVLQSNGILVEIPRDSGTPTILAVGIAAVSDQGIDNQGLAVVDVVTTSGNAFEVHDTGGTGTWVSLGSGIQSARAGQGVSYVLDTSGNVFEYDDATMTSRPVVGSATGIDAGTDAQGVNAVDVILPFRLTLAASTARAAVPGFGIVFPTNAAWQYSDDTGAHIISFNVQSVSAGRQGYATYITLAGEGYLYSRLGGWYQDLGSGVAQVTAGTDANGYWLVDLLLSNGTLQELGFGHAQYTVATGVKSINKARLGAVDVVKTTPRTIAAAAPRLVVLGGGTVVGLAPSAWEHTPSGWRFLSSNAVAAE
jgi:hypothetical protein